MFLTLARLAIPQSQIQRAILKTLPELPPSLRTGPGNLYEILSRKASVENRIVHQMRWSSKNIGDCYWQVTRARLKCEGKHGRAWGLKYWRGKLVSRREEEIRGGLKYAWLEGKSVSKAPPIPE